MVVTVPEKTVNVTTGGNATLVCTYTSSGPLANFFIQWSFYSAKESQQHTVRYLFIIKMIFKVSLSHHRLLLHLIVLSSLQTRGAGNVGVPTLKTMDWGAMKFRGGCTKLPRLLIPTGMPELL